MGKVFTTDELYAIMRGEQQNQQTAQDARAAMNDRVSERNAQRRAEQLAGVQAKTAGYANGTNPTAAGSVNEGAGEEKPKGTGIDLSPKQNVTGNALYDQWREAMTGRLGKDFEARMNAAEAAADPKKLQDAYRTASDEYDKAKKAESAAKEKMKTAPSDAAAEKHRPDYESAKAAREAAEAEFGRSKAQLESAGVELPDTSTWGKIKHLFTGEGQRTTDGFTAEQAAQYKELLSRLDGIQAASAFALTTEQNDALEKERAETLSALHQMDADARRAERAYDARDRAGAFFKSWGKGTAASYTNTAGSMLDLADVAHQASSETQRRIADNPYAGYVTDPLSEANFAAAPVSEETSGFLASQRKERDALYETADRLLTESEQQMAKAKQGTSAAAQFALDAAKTGMDIAADTAASAIGVPGLANMAVRVYGSEAQQARLSGDDAQTAAAKGMKAAMIEVLTEKISGPFEKAYGSSLGKAAAATKVGKAVNAAVDKLKSSGLIRLAMGAAGEGFEEGMSDVLNTVADHVAGWDDGTGTIWDDIKGDKEQILYDMLLGAFVGAFGGAGNLARGNANATADAAPTQQTTTEAQSAAPTQQTAPAASTESRALMESILAGGRVNTTTANAILADQQLTQAFTELTGISLSGNTADMRTQISNGARAYSYSQTQTQREESARTAEKENLSAEMARQNEQLAALSQEEAARDADWAQRREEMENYGSYDSYVRGIVRDGGSYAEAGEIARTPELRATWEKITGQTLPGSVNKARGMVMNYRADVAMPQDSAQQPQTRTEARGDNPAPAEAENVKQAGSDALNSALNLNNVETQAEAPAQAQKNTASMQQKVNIDNTASPVYNDTSKIMGGVSGVAGTGIAADSNGVPGIHQDSNAVHQGRGGLDGVSVGSGLVLLNDKSQATLRERGVAVEAKDASADKAAFSAALADARESDAKHGWAVTPKSAQELAESRAKLITTQNGAAGLAVAKDGDIEAVYSNKAAGAPKGVTKSMIPIAIANGGTKLDCYGAGLVRLYAQYGFVPVAKVKFNPEYANPGWDASKGTPDIYFMMHNGDNADAVVAKEGTYSIPTKAELDALPTMDYDEAYSYRDSLIQEGKRAGSAGSAPTTAQNVKSENQENAEGGSNLGSKSLRAKTSQTAGTIMEADITSDERAAQLNKYVQNGRFDYIPDTNKRQTRRAVQAIKEKGWQRAVQEFHDSVAAGKSGKDLVARGAVLLNSAGNSDASSQTYLELASDVIELGHKAGETLQALKILQQLTPEGRLYCMTKTVDKLNRQLSDGQKKAIAKQRLGREYDAKAIKDVVDDYGVKLDQKLIDAYLAAKTDAERDTVISEIQNDIAAQIPSTFEDKLVALRYTAMLGNFKTQGRNVLGNTSSLVTKIVKDRLAATIEGVGYVVSGCKMERTRSVWAGGKLYKEAWADFQAHKAEALGEEKYTNVAQKTAKGIEDARTIFKVNGTWGTENAASEFGRSKAAKFARKGADVGMAALEGWRKATNWTMEAGDAIFARTAYADAMAGWLRAHKVNSFAEATEAQLEKARAFAAKEAQEATFRDSNVFSDAISSFDSGWSSSDNAMLRGMGKMSQGIAPFRKTPANVAVRAFEYSPLGVAESIVKGVQAVKGKATAADVINSISKNATGVAIMWAGAALSGLGKLRGKEDDKELDAAQKANGAMDYSYITDEGKYISLSQFAPVSIPLFMGARFAELARDVGISPKTLAMIAAGTTGVMLDQSMLSGLNDALSGLDNYGSDQDALSQFIENSLLSFVSQYVPTILRQTEQASEKYRQTTYTDKNDPWLTTDKQRWLGKASAGVPGVDFQQEDYIDMWGRKTEQGSLGKRIWDAYFNPVYTSQDKSTPLDKELERLHTENRDKESFPDVYPDSGSIYTDLDGKGTQMTREEFEQYRIERGTKSRELAQEFFDSDEYGMLSDEQRAEVLRDLYSLAADRALKNVQAAHKISYTGGKDTLAALPDIPQYLAADKLLSDAKNNPTSTNWDSIDKVIDEFSKLSQGAQDVLTDKGLNVPGLRYSHALGMGAEDWYSAHEAVAEGEKTLGGTDAAKAISIYNSMEGKSDEEILNAMRAQLMPKSDDGGKQNATVRRAEAYMTAAKNNGAEGNLGEWLTLTAELKDADENDHVSKDDVEKAWTNMGLGAKETYAGITLNDFYNIAKSGTKSYANNPDYATQIDKIYAELYPDAPSVKAQLSGSVRTSERADDGGKTASGVPRNRDAAADWVMKHSRAAKRRIS